MELLKRGTSKTWYTLVYCGLHPWLSGLHETIDAESLDTASFAPQTFDPVIS